jgi:hypothetical protein
MLSPYKHITYDSYIYRHGIRWAINTSHNRMKNVRGLRTRNVERGIDAQMYMIMKTIKKPRVTKPMCAMDE